MPKIILNEIALPYQSGEGKFIEAAYSKLRELGISSGEAQFGAIYRRTVDARHKNAVKLVCSVAFNVERGISEHSLRAIGGVNAAEEYAPPVADDRCKRLSDTRPLVVGFGPAGMFAALLLAESGMFPIIIERGDPVSERVRKVERFYRDGILDTESNIQFGAGGAGTFSDGKIVTRIGDPRTRYVLRRFVEFGAPEDCLTSARPHIGTDLLRGVVERLSCRIVSLGGEILYRTRFERLRPHGIVTSRGDIASDSVILAIGHSARDTYMKIRGDLSLVPKDFSVGVRIEHLTRDIDRAIYGDADLSILGHAEYNLSHREGGRGVYSFCMCPGGEVVAAASEQGGVVTNGMSDSGRGGRNSNSALAVSVLSSDVGNSVEGGLDFIRSLERRAYELGGGEYKAPVQTVGDFMSGDIGHEPRRVLSSYMGGDRYALRDLSSALPKRVSELLKTGIRRFGGKIDGFDAPDAVLTGYETRTSSPVRILRGGDMRAIMSNVGAELPLVFPCGEGAGYAGGITSAAVDGIKAAENIILGVDRS